MEGSCSTGKSPQRAVVPVEEEEYRYIFGRLVKYVSILSVKTWKRGPCV
jgi:hypothetical protein